MGYSKKITFAVAAAGAVAASAVLAGPAAHQPGVSRSAVRQAPQAVVLAGYSSVETCTSVAGTAGYRPGLTKVVRDETASLSATISGCSNPFRGVSAGAGTLTATLSGASSISAVALTGTFTVTWPAASGFNPSHGTLSLSGPDAHGVYTVHGTVAGGAFTGSRLTTALVSADTANGAATISQRFTNTAPLQAQQNLG